MKISDIDTRDALEKTSENMERMTVLMDKMYIKLEQKEVPYMPQIYHRAEDRIKDNLVEKQLERL